MFAQLNLLVKVTDVLRFRIDGPQPKPSFSKKKKESLNKV